MGIRPLPPEGQNICHVTEGTAGGGHHFTEKSVAQTNLQWDGDSTPCPNTMDRQDLVLSREHLNEMNSFKVDCKVQQDDKRDVEIAAAAAKYVAAEADEVDELTQMMHACQTHDAEVSRLTSESLNTGRQLEAAKKKAKACKDRKDKKIADTKAAAEKIRRKK